MARSIRPGNLGCFLFGVIMDKGAMHIYKSSCGHRFSFHLGEYLSSKTDRSFLERECTYIKLSVVKRHQIIPYVEPS